MKSPLIPIDLNVVLSGAQLPALPQSAIRLLELSRDPANGPAEFAVPIESDAGLTGQVLRFVNSSYFGFSREISSVKLAVALVGVRTIKNFALWSAVFSLMPNPRCGPFELKGLWQDSLRRAIFARKMAHHCGASDPEEPFAAALLQDMAVPLLAKEAPDVYMKLLESRDNGVVRLSDLEQRVFGWNHAQAASRMARHWNLPEAFAQLIESHLETDRWSSRPESNPAAAAVALSALLPSLADTNWHDAEQFDALYARMLPANGPTAPELLDEIDREFMDFAPVLNVVAPKRSLVEYYQLAAV
jgi:HD-like signal output (HDOD) protein